MPDAELVLRIEVTRFNHNYFVKYDGEPYDLADELAAIHELELVLGRRIDRLLGLPGPSA